MNSLDKHTLLWYYNSGPRRRFCEKVVGGFAVRSRVSRRITHPQQLQTCATNASYGDGWIPRGTLKGEVAKDAR